MNIVGTVITHAAPLAIFEAADTASALPDWVRLMPVGDIAAIDGRKWSLADPEAVISASLERRSDLVVDYDHATDRGGPAPAAGWIQELAVRDGYIVARVDWTRTGAERLAAKEYRYLSPTFLSDKKGRVTRILRAALVNSPALPELGALADETTEDHAMTTKPDEATAALADLRAQLDAEKAQLAADRAALDAQLAQAAAERAALAAEIALTAAKADVQRLVASGKVPPAAADDMAGLLAHLEAIGGDIAGKKPRETLLAMLSALPCRVELREVSAPADAPADGTADPILSLAAAAQAYQAECRNKGMETSIAEAVRHVQQQRAAR